MYITGAFERNQAGRFQVFAAPSISQGLKRSFGDLRDPYSVSELT